MSNKELKLDMIRTRLDLVSTSNLYEAIDDLKRIIHDLIDFIDRNSK